MEKRIVKVMGDLKTALDMRPATRITRTYITPKSTITDEDRRKSLHEAQREVEEYSIQQLAAIREPITQYTQKLASRKLTERVCEKVKYQMHRAQEPR
jgi:2',3'-cyclic-nucleotide 2'-phosphodiesterase (5'-nucleotidase family)